jgi:hypothetical protein
MEPGGWPTFTFFVKVATHPAAATRIDPAARLFSMSAMARFRQPCSPSTGSVEPIPAEDGDWGIRFPQFCRRLPLARRGLSAVMCVLIRGAVLIGAAKMGIR